MRQQLQRLRNLPNPAVQALLFGLASLVLLTLFLKTLLDGVPCLPQQAGQAHCDMFFDPVSFITAIFSSELSLYALFDQAVGWLFDLLAIGVGLAVCVPVALIGLGRWRRPPPVAPAAPVIPGWDETSTRPLPRPAAPPPAPSVRAARSRNQGLTDDWERTDE